MNALSYVQMVLWSFFGVRRRAAAAKDVEKTHPLTVVVTAVFLAALFGFTLWGAATLAVRALT